MPSLADRIKDLRKSHGLTQDEFGRLFGIVKSTVSLYEHGKSTPNDQIKTEICKHFNISMDYLLGISDNSSNQKENPLTKEQGDTIVREALKDTGLLDKEGNLSEDGKKVVTEFLAKNADLLKQIIDKK